MRSRMSSNRKWATWLVAAAVFFIVATNYSFRSEGFDISSLTHSPPSKTKATAQTPPPGLEHDSPRPPSGSKPQSTSQPTSLASCPECPTCPAVSEPAEKKLFLDLPPEYTVLSDEDRLCQSFYTEKYLQNIAAASTPLVEGANSAVTEFNVPTHPAHRKLTGASPVWLLQGVHWDPAKGSFIANADAEATKPIVLGGAPLGVLTYDENATGCLRSTKKRELIVYPALWEGTYPNIWHRLLEIWQAVHSFDAMRIALDPATGQPFLTKEQIASANVVLPSDAPGPWGDLWKIVTPTEHAALPPSALAPDTCYDVVIPTVGWASPFWSALLTSGYDTCPRQTLLTSFVNRLFKHYSVMPRPPADVAARPQAAPTITVIQRAANRKFRDFEALLEKLHARHPQSPVNVVDLALLSIKDQIALAQTTDVWVGHHGAGMTYVLFMPRTTAVVEILPPLFVSRGFRWLARMRGLVHFTVREMWRVEYEEKFEGKAKPADWKPERQGDNDANEWQSEEWVNIKHEDLLDVVDAAVLSQRERVNDL